MRVAIGYFDEITEDLVVADLERAYAGSRSLLRLNSGDSVFSPLAERAPLPQRSLDSFTHTGLVPNRDWWAIHQRAGDLVADVDAVVPGSLVHVEHRHLAPGRTERALERGFECGQPRQRIAKRAQFTGRCTAGSSFSGKSFHVPHPIECITKRCPNER